MIIKENNNKKKRFIKDKKKRVFSSKLIDALSDEIQIAEASSMFREFHMFPRQGSKRSHRLSGDYKDCYGVGLDHKYRFIVKPGKLNMDSKEIEIIEYIIDYH